MKLIWKYVKQYINLVALGMGIKLLGTLGELSLPYILEHIIDNIVPLGKTSLVIIWGLLMILMAVVTMVFNIKANRVAAGVSRDCIYEVRRDLFVHTANLNGAKFDEVGLPSLTSRMTSDSYNVQNFIMRMQTLGVRGPIMLVGGIVITLSMDWRLAMVLIIAIPILMAGVMGVTVKGTPLFDKVQDALDSVVRVMRENITGIRVVKALSREEYEKKRYGAANESLTRKDLQANIIMAIPGPFMQLCLNIGLTMVVIFGARLVNSGMTKPGVILAFLTYFNLILMAVMGLNRIFVMYSKAAASADRIAAVLEQETDLPVMKAPESDDTTGKTRLQTQDLQDKIVFDHVSFSYNNPEDTDSPDIPDVLAVSGKPAVQDTLAVPGKPAAPGNQSLQANQPVPDKQSTPGTENPQRPAAEHVRKFGGGKREKCLSDISFRLKPGESLGIIGATGAGKTSIINLLMRFYDADEGTIYVDGRDVRTYDKDELHRKFGVVFQNDIIFADTIGENISFGRNLSEDDIVSAARAANADDFIRQKKDGYQHEAAIKGANLSGGQKQRILIARALAAKPEILVLDDASSALDYRTDASVRKAIRENYKESTLIMIAQRISSVMSMDHIMVLEDGKILDYGKHDELMERCGTYNEIYQSQMGNT